MLPTSAKITALVCSGRIRLNVSQGVSKFACQKLIWIAARRPTSRPTRPNTTDARVNLRTMPSS